jgi:hypothetical protein
MEKHFLFLLHGGGEDQDSPKAYNDKESTKPKIIPLLNFIIMYNCTCTTLHNNFSHVKFETGVSL